MAAIVSYCSGIVLEKCSSVQFLTHLIPVVLNKTSCSDLQNVVTLPDVLNLSFYSRIGFLAVYQATFVLKEQFNTMPLFGNNTFKQKLKM